MTEAFIGEIRPFAISFAPDGWAECDGSLLPIQYYQALFAVIGITYGGDGRTTFGLPDLRGRVPVGYGQGQGLTQYDIGDEAGVEGVALTTMQMPSHQHTLNMEAQGYAKSPSAFKAQPTANTSFPARYIDATNPASTLSYLSFAPSGNLTPMNTTSSIGAAGAGKAHENRQPFLVMRYCICTTAGYFPVRP